MSENTDLTSFEFALAGVQPPVELEVSAGSKLVLAMRTVVAEQVSVAVVDPRLARYLGTAVSSNGANGSDAEFESGQVSGMTERFSGPPLVAPTNLYEDTEAEDRGEFSNNGEANGYSDGQYDWGDTADDHSAEPAFSGHGSDGMLMPSLTVPEGFDQDQSYVYDYVQPYAGGHDEPGVQEGDIQSAVGPNVGYHDAKGQPPNPPEYPSVTYGGERPYTDEVSWFDDGLGADEFGFVPLPPDHENFLDHDLTTTGGGSSRRTMRALFGLGLLGLGAAGAWWATQNVDSLGLPDLTRILATEENDNDVVAAPAEIENEESGAVASGGTETTDPEVVAVQPMEPSAASASSSSTTTTTTTASSTTASASSTTSTSPSSSSSATQPSSTASTSTSTSTSTTSTTQPSSTASTSTSTTLPPTTTSTTLPTTTTTTLPTTTTTTTTPTTTTTATAPLSCRLYKKNPNGPVTSLRIYTTGIGFADEYKFYNQAGNLITTSSLLGQPDFKNELRYSWKVENFPKATKVHTVVGVFDGEESDPVYCLTD